MDERNPSRRGKEGRPGETGEPSGSPGGSRNDEQTSGNRTNAETPAQAVRGTAHDEGDSLLRGSDLGKERGRDTAQKAKEKSRQAAGKAKEKSRETAEKAKESGRQAISEAREQTGQVSREARDRLAEAAEERKGDAARALERVSRALRSASESMREEDADMLGRYGEQAADQIDRLSDYVHETDFNSMMSGAEDFARRRPELFYGGLLLGGVLAGRFLRSSDSHSRSSQGRMSGGRNPRWEGSYDPRSPSPAERGAGVASGVGRHEPFGGPYD